MIKCVEEIIKTMCVEFAYESIEQYKKNRKYRDLIDDESVSIDKKVEITAGNFECWADAINKVCDCEECEEEAEGVMNEAESILRNAAKKIGDTGNGVEEDE